MLFSLLSGVLMHMHARSCCDDSHPKWLQRICALGGSAEPGTRCRQGDPDRGPDPQRLRPAGLLTLTGNPPPRNKNKNFKMSQNWHLTAQVRWTFSLLRQSQRRPTLQKRKSWTTWGQPMTFRFCISFQTLIIRCMNLQCCLASFIYVCSCDEQAPDPL